MMASSGRRGDDMYLYDPYGEDEKVASAGSDSTDADVARGECEKEPVPVRGLLFRLGRKVV
jgi:hypothetical protein